jgi:HEAT repeat protein/outer membrane protein assembly factor BamB
MRRVRLFLVTAAVGFGLSGLPLLRAGDAGDADIKLLETLGISTDTAGVLDFFRFRTPKDTDVKVLAGFVRQLAGSYRERQEATRVLVLRGPISIPYLSAGMKGASLEVASRAEQCIRKIESVGPEYPAAAARVLARRQNLDAITVLLQYLPQADDEWLREEVLGSLGKLLIRGGKVDPLLTADLKSPVVQRRAVAAYILGRHGDRDQRETLRRLLDDPSAEVRRHAAQGLLGKRPWLSLHDNAGSDESLLRSILGGVNEPTLLELLRKRTLTEEDQKRLRGWIRQLGAPAYYARAEASRKLIAQGPPALSFLRDAARDSDLEIARRVEICIEAIKRGPGPALPAAALRILARPESLEHSPAIAIQAILAYVPFVDDASVEEEALSALCMLSVRQGGIDPLVPAALHDPMPARRAAAAYVLGRVGAAEHCLAARRLLADPEATVRFRAAQGLLFARDREAVPVLIALLAESKMDLVWQVEELLRGIAGDREVVAAADQGSRQKTLKAWQVWWRSHAERIDLPGVSQEQNLGLIAIAEYDSPLGQVNGRVLELARDGKERWQITGVAGAMDAQVLANGRVLVAENAARRISERDMSGAVKWEYPLSNNPIACQRLANGNTFIATYNQVMEVTPAGQIAYEYNRGPGFYLFSARKYANGQIVCMTAQGKILVLDARTGQEVRSVQVGPQGGWCSAEMLPNGRYLVATMVDNKVREVDGAGKTHWEISFPGAFRATRLPNGHTVVASMTTRRVAEFDRNGKSRWEKTCTGRPWSVRYR